MTDSKLYNTIMGIGGFCVGFLAVLKITGIFDWSLIMIMAPIIVPTIVISIAMITYEINNK